MVHGGARTCARRPRPTHTWIAPTRGRPHGCSYARIDTGMICWLILLCARRSEGAEFGTLALAQKNGGAAEQSAG